MIQTFTNKKIQLRVIQLMPDHVLINTCLVLEFEMVYSVGEVLYYVNHPSIMPTRWLSVSELIGPVDERDKSGALDGMLEITLHTGETYHRAVKPFAFWDIPIGRRVPGTKNLRGGNLYKDYMSCEITELYKLGKILDSRWFNDMFQERIIVLPNQSSLVAKVGDFIIIGDDGVPRGTIPTEQLEKHWEKVS